MSLKLHPLPDLVAINTVSGTQHGRQWTNPVTIIPGEPVRHKSDPRSFGICLSRRWIWDDRPMQCDVLWSREPTGYSRSPEEDVAYFRHKLAQLGSK